MPETKLIRFGVTYNEEPVNQALLLGDGDSLANDLHLLETPNELKLTVTRQQYTDLLSAAINGCNRYFPENWIEILYPLIKAGKEWANDMDCDDIADCIDSSEAVQDAIIQNNINNNDFYGTTNPDQLSETGTEEPIMDTRFPPSDRDEPAHNLDSCNLDELWGGIRFMVEKLDERGRDALEQIAAKTERWEKFAEFISVVPILGDLAEATVMAVVDEIEVIITLYNSHSTEEVLDSIACDLFELVCELCRYPTFDEILDYYAGFGIDGIEDWASISLKAMMDYMTGSASVAALTCYYTVITFQLWIMYAQASWLGMRGSRYVSLWLDNGEEFANDAWIALCDGCSNDYGYADIDFTTTGGIFNFPNGRDANGALFTDAGTFKQSLAGYLAPANNEILFLEVLIARAGGSAGINDSWAIRSNMGTNGVFPTGDVKYDETALANGEAWRCWRPSVGSAFRQFLLLARVQDNGAGSTIYIKAVKVTCLNVDTGMTIVHTYPSACP